MSTVIYIDILICMLIVNVYKGSWKKKYTQADVVKATGLSAVTVNKMFNSTPHDFKFSSVEKVAKFLGCKALDILVEVPDEE